MNRVGVVVPTRNRPEDLARCLAALEQARSEQDFIAYVCDSSDAATRAAVAEVCGRYGWVEMRHHDGRSVPEARNFCTNVCETELMVSIDDDVEITAKAIRALVDMYDAGSGARVVGGAVSWGSPDDPPTGPMVLRRIGFGRTIEAGEEPDFLNSAFLLYPRSFAQTWPWNERMRRSSDVLMGAIWRRAGVQMLWARDARALHADNHQMLSPHDSDDYAYALLAHGVIASRSVSRTVLLSLLAFAAGLRLHLSDPRRLATFTRSWARGHRRFARDHRYLAAVTRRPMPRCTPSVPGAHSEPPEAG